MFAMNDEKKEIEKGSDWRQSSDGPQRRSSKEEGQNPAGNLQEPQVVGERASADTRVGAATRPFFGGVAPHSLVSRFRLTDGQGPWEESQKREPWFDV